MDAPIVNKVAESALITIDLEQYLPTTEAISFDMKAYLFQELILKEKDFRKALQETDWNVYEKKHVALFCSADAIVPMWAFMLVASHLQPIAASVFFGSKDEYKTKQLLKNISSIPVEAYHEKRIVIKGCGKEPIPEAAYVAITQHLLPVAKSIMYGEPCSTVPIYKKK